mgnify:CR=1 FL=1
MWEQAHGLQRPVRAARYPGIPFSPESPGFSGNRSGRPSVTFFIVFLSFSPKRILKTGEPDLSCFHENEFGINVGGHEIISFSGLNALNTIQITGTRTRSVRMINITATGISKTTFLIFIVFFFFIPLILLVHSSVHQNRYKHNNNKQHD